MTEAKRPNIMFIMADQMTGTLLDCPTLKIPNIQRLRKEGVTFQNCYSNSPLCAPARFSMMAGQLPSRIGSYDNAAEFPSSIPTFGHYLRAQGYSTTLCGKMHFIGADQLHGFEERLTTDIYPADFGWTPNWEKPEERPEWYHNMLSVVQSGKCVTSNQLDFDEDVAFNTKRKLLDISRGGDDRPFFLFVSLTHPHDPYAISQEYWDRYTDEEIPMPSVPEVPEELDDPHSKRLRHVMALDDYKMTDERVKSARHAYFGSISYVDDKVGQILDTLEKTGLRDNTIIYFTSDHGDMLGERNLWYKMNYFEGATRIPMVISAPTSFGFNRGQTVKENVSLMDVLPTLMELANVNTPNYDFKAELCTEIDGGSLLSYLRNSDSQIFEERKRTVIGEYLGEGAIAPLFMIRRGNLKFVHSDPDPDQLFDLDSDPKEMNNLAKDPKFADTVKSFLEEVTKRWNSKELEGKVIQCQRRRRFLHNALMQKYIPWDFQPVKDASTMYVRRHMDLDDIEKRARYPQVPIPLPDNRS